MPSYQLTDHPAMIPAPEYGEAVEELARRLETSEGFLSLYSIGGVSAPGISDLDVVIVWDDGIVHQQDWRPTSPLGRQLFIHSLYGTSRSLFLEAQSYTCYAPFRLKIGKDLLAGRPGDDLDKDVRHQIAREYLLRLFIGLYLQHLQRLLRIRSILLNANGIASDLEVLTPGNLQATQLIEELKLLRRSWFEKQNPPEGAFIDWFGRFLKWLTAYATEQLGPHKLYLPEDRTYSLGRNIRIRKGEAVEFPEYDMRPTFLRPLLGRKYFNLLNRINRPVFTLPFETSGLPPAVKSYFDFTERHRDYNREFLPRHLPLTSSLHLQ
jgi:hypothetical protein